MARNVNRRFPIDQVPQETSCLEEDLLSCIVRNSRPLGSGRGKARAVQTAVSDLRWGFVEQMLPILDSVENLTHLSVREADRLDPIVSNWLKTVNVIGRKLKKVLAAQGVEEIECLGTNLDFHRHEVLGTVERADIDDCTVVEVRQRGYEFLGQVMRPAGVVVSRQPREATEPTEDSVEEGGED